MTDNQQMREALEAGIDALKPWIGKINTVNIAAEKMAAALSQPAASAEVVERLKHIREYIHTYCVITHPKSRNNGDDPEDYIKAHLDDAIAALSTLPAQPRTLSPLNTLAPEPDDVACQLCGHVTKAGEHHSHPCAADSGHPDDAAQPRTMGDDLIEALKAVESTVIFELDDEAYLDGGIEPKHMATIRVLLAAGYGGVDNRYRTGIEQEKLDLLARVQQLEAALREVSDSVGIESPQTIVGFIQDALQKDDGGK